MSITLDNIIVSVYLCQKTEQSSAIFIFWGLQASKIKQLLALYQKLLKVQTMSMLSSTITLHDEKTKVLKKKYSTSLIKIYFFTNHCLSPNPGDKGRCWPRTNFSPNQGNKGKKADISEIFSDSKRSQNGRLAVWSHCRRNLQKCREKRHRNATVIGGQTRHTEPAKPIRKYILYHIRWHSVRLLSESAWNRFFLSFPKFSIQV